MVYRDYKQDEYSRQEIKENNKNLYIYESTLDGNKTAYMKPFDGLENTFGIPTVKTNGKSKDRFFTKKDYTKLKREYDNIFEDLDSIVEDYSTILFPTNFGIYAEDSFTLTLKNIILGKITKKLQKSDKFFSIYRKQKKNNG